jgi:ABC-type multidrug transport system fused ATPase/permease subunit
MLSDKILVLDFGKIIEYDTPLNLLNNNNSLFYSLVIENGKENIDLFKNIIKLHKN